VGSRWVLEATYQQLQSKALLIDPAYLEILDLATAPFSPGQHQPSSGAASFAYLETALNLIRTQQARALITGPISKTAWHQAGHCFPGQTEVIAQGASNYGMFFVARSPHTTWCWRMLLATTHIPLAQVPTTLTPELVGRKLDLLLKVLREVFHEPNPLIKVAGLNPHSGEGGQLGREEQDWLIPLLANYPVQGPIPPDTLWVESGRAWFDPQAQAAAGYLALYHDQGLIPLKLLAFDRAVNMTVGLPFLRTSPDHGTAFDIVGQGIARATSLLEALYWADVLTV
jgi:4-hydroxythreonine-4-phosphate dehydrogenase